MTEATDPTPEQIAEMRAAVAAFDAKEAAERQAKAQAAADAVKALVASETFRAALKLMETTFVNDAPKETELGYAVNMMERLRDRFPA
ncbi:hypothetical protein [Sphingomonas beigongshangi]|uniref:hypothetical protein n=1 Tax=Sphingomonas beigongshangi TaxID=2782540 RepID=UPI001AEF14DA|nr:hypothetical protein [Sphingomonas beigongshangi]